MGPSLIWRAQAPDDRARGRTRLVLALAVAWFIGRALPAAAQTEASGRGLPALTAPVNDFANVIDPASRTTLDNVIVRLQRATGDVIVVATVPAIEPFADIREQAVALFENRGRGIGQKAQDNGVLVLLAPNQRTVWVEAGYGLEEWITDGYAGELSRNTMRPAFREERYGAGLVAGVAKIAARIAEGRGIALEGLDPPRQRNTPRIPLSTIIVVLIVLYRLITSSGGGGGRGRRWGNDGWSGWSSGVGPLGGGWSSGGSFGGGFGGGGSSGGFGGFGGGRSGGGGGGASW